MYIINIIEEYHENISFYLGQELSRLKLGRCAVAPLPLSSVVPERLVVLLMEPAHQWSPAQNFLQKR